MFVQYSRHMNFSMCYSLQQTSCSTKHTKTSSTFYIAKGKLLVTFRLGTALKMMFSIKDFFSKSDLTFTEEVLNGKLHFLCSEESKFVIFYRFIFGNKMTLLQNWLQVSLSCNWAIFNKITKRSPDGNSQSLSYNIYRSQVFFFTSQILVAS